MDGFFYVLIGVVGEMGVFLNMDFQENNIIDCFFFDDFDICEQVQFLKGFNCFLDFRLWNVDFIIYVEVCDIDYSVIIIIVCVNDFNVVDFVFQWFVVFEYWDVVLISLCQEWQVQYQERQVYQVFQKKGFCFYLYRIVLQVC